MIRCNSPFAYEGRCVADMDSQQSRGGTICCDMAEDMDFDRERILIRCEHAEDSGRLANNISWLMTTPCGDCNFKSALGRATEEEIQETMSRLSGKDGVKTKIKVLEAELRKRSRQTR